MGKVEEKEKGNEEKVQIKFTLPKWVYDEFYAEFRVLRSLSPTKIGNFEEFDDIVIFYLKKLIGSCGHFFSLENNLFNIMEHLRKMGVPIDDFEDLLKKLDIIKTTSKDIEKGRS